MNSFPLLFAKEGVRLKIVNIKSNEKIAQHLQSLGFVKSTEICLVKKSNTNCIIKILDSKIGLDSSICNKIYVVELEQKEERTK